ncbi:hypothetical protein B0H19DRAFT_1069652 [Mycena capillaripes]|nr:hypothetical protein B0H19DRAFT_1069652 [Mycena capillaripes]
MNSTCRDRTVHGATSGTWRAVAQGTIDAASRRIRRFKCEKKTIRTPGFWMIKESKMAKWFSDNPSGRLKRHSSPILGHDVHTASFNHPALGEGRVAKDSLTNTMNGGLVEPNSTSLGLMQEFTGFESGTGTLMVHATARVTRQFPEARTQGRGRQGVLRQSIRRRKTHANAKDLLLRLRALHHHGLAKGKGRSLYLMATYYGPSSVQAQLQVTEEHGRFTIAIKMILSGAGIGLR